ncbi:cortactin [Planoprotostelium fungivorum]|uniref:Cortactin n=1 Tax=Planoprotostelium fungivorum TaxID=1890364 RepID=A0A2P6N499_9EUKA|nr:cortactin [Planoprotostelium fungivorum]
MLGKQKQPKSNAKTKVTGPTVVDRFSERTSKFLTDYSKGITLELDRPVDSESRKYNFHSLPNRQSPKITRSPSLPRMFSSSNDDNNDSSNAEKNKQFCMRPIKNDSVIRRRESAPEKPLDYNSSSGLTKPPARPERPPNLGIASLSRTSTATKINEKYNAETTPSSSQVKNHSALFTILIDPSQYASPDRPPRPSVDKLKQLRYNSIRPLPVKSGSSEGMATIEEYKQREVAMKEKIKRVLASVNEERLQLHKMVKHYKKKSEEEEARNRTLTKKVEEVSSQNADLQSQISEIQATRARRTSEPTPLSATKEQDVNNELKLKLNRSEQSFVMEKRKNTQLEEKVKQLEKMMEESRRDYEDMIDQRMNKMQSDMQQQLRMSASKIEMSQKKPASPPREEKPAPAVPQSNGNYLNEDNSLKPVPVAGAGGVKKGKPTLLALYDYTAVGSEDLEFQEGDLLVLHKRYNDGWWLAGLDGNMGRVPSNYVQDLSSVARVKMVAKGTFQPECQGDLPFSKGQTVWILNQEDDWWIGELEDGSIGYLPRNYVGPE